MESTELMFIHLVIGSRVVLDLMCNVPIILCEWACHNLIYYLLDYEMLII